MVLPGVARQVVHQTAEPSEPLRDRHHADHHHGVAQFSGQTLDLLGHGPQVDVGDARGHLLQARLGDDQFADPVHQFVQALGRHTHGLRASPSLGFPSRLFGGRSLSRMDGNSRSIDLGRVDLGRVERLDLQDHVVDQKDEHVLDRRTGMFGGQAHVPAELAVLGRQCRKRRDRVGESRDRALAELSQFVQKGERFGAVGQGVGRQPEAHLPGRGPWAGRQRARDRLILDGAAQLLQQSLSGAGRRFAPFGQGRACGPGRRERRR